MPAILAGVSAVASALWLRSIPEHGDGSEDAPPHLRIPLPGVVWILLVSFLALTALPVPRSVDFISGHLRGQQNSAALNAIGDASDIGLVDRPPSAAFSLTRNRAGTLKYILLAIAAGCLAAASASTNSPSRSTQLAILVTLVLIISVFGFIHQWLSSSRSFWWFLPVSHGQPVGGFVSRTHFAGYIALLCPAALALMFDAIVKRKVVPSLAWCITTSAMSMVVLLSLARGAVIALAAGLITTFLAALALRPMRDRIAFSLAAVVVTAAIACTIQSGILPDSVLQKVSSRLGTLRAPMNTESAKARFAVWRDSIEVWGNYPLIGAGASGFRMVFPRHRQRTDRPSFKQAENEYVQTLVDLGVVGSILLATSAACTAIAAFRSGRTGPTASATVLAIPGIAVVFLVHNAIDFPVRTPLYALTAAWIAGMCFNSSVSWPVNILLPRRILIPVALSLIPIVALPALLPPLTRALERDSPDHIQNADMNELAKIVQWSPTSWQAWYHMGRRACAAGTRPAMRFGEQCMTRAASYDPNNYRLWEALAFVRAEMNDVEGSREALKRLKSLRSWKTGPAKQTEGL